MTSTMSSNKPYLVRAFYDWIQDNELTPYIVVDVSVYGVLVPMHYVNDGQIILNISAGSVGSIALGSETIEFSARFGGKLEYMVVPYGAIAAIYAKENGAGTSLPIEHPEVTETSEQLADDVPEKFTLSDVSSDKKSVKKVSDIAEKAKRKASFKVVK